MFCPRHPCRDSATFSTTVALILGAAGFVEGHANYDSIVNSEQLLASHSAKPSTSPVFFRLVSWSAIDSRLSQVARTFIAILTFHFLLSLDTLYTFDQDALYTRIERSRTRETERKTKIKRGRAEHVEGQTERERERATIGLERSG